MSSRQTTKPAAKRGSKGSNAKAAKSSRSELVSREILEVSARLFAERSYDGTTLQDIADAIGVTRGALYYYMDSKEDLLATLVAETSVATAELLNGLRARDELGPTETLRAFAYTLVQQRAAAGDRFKMLERTESSMPPNVAAEHLRARRAVLAALVEVVEEGVTSGELRPLDARVAAFSVLGICNWVAWWFKPGTAHPPGPVAEQIADSVVAMLAAPEDRRAAGGSPMAALGRVREDLDYLERLLPAEPNRD
jgi:AcrR family transcriptional regulator